MGAWGTGVFENDDAADWLDEFASDGADKVSEAFDAVIEAARTGSIDSMDASFAMAAAEAVAYAVGTPDPDLDDEVVEAFDARKDEVAALEGIADRAIAALDLIVSDPERSELLELWEDADEDDAEAFRETVADLRRRVDG
ncbi:DUF4259 domain-containing protein [Algicella marina]|uniref:DUF4259 domain-containing protein n=1 Tax=Algicella marina TaxID=2683284 RepID=A0A6P1SVA5_9RHOB|nr:DUF4259 domain-containing protein [Algicella marina]QHQ34624.1 DUF4259 domain-containing protein [Algicella marina]